MIQARTWPVRLMYLLIAAALAISMFIVAAPAQKVSGAPDAEVKAEWERIGTPSMDGFLLAPESTIYDYALADGGDVAYAIVESYDEDPEDDEGGSWSEYEYRLVKSTDGAATWKDITKGIKKVIDDKPSLGNLDRLIQVATDWVDPNFVAVALTVSAYTVSPLHVFISTDGGTTFADTGEVEDGVYLDEVADLAVSVDVGGKRDIAIGGVDDSHYAAIFRCTVTAGMPGAWVDARYDGWDNMWMGDTNSLDDLSSWLVTDIIFSPNWATDRTILVTTVADDSDEIEGIYLQSGSWGTSPGWNKKSTLGIDAVLIMEGESFLSEVMDWDARGIAGITLPSNYNSKYTDTRVLWVWVNYRGPSDTDPARSRIVRVDNDDANPIIQQVKDGKIWLTNVSYWGTIAEGKAIAGVLGSGTSFVAAPCAGVQVYRNEGITNMDICCERWKKACKPPTGRTGMAVSYVRADKAYAVALQGVMDYDEGAWSVSFSYGAGEQVGDTWNQLSLIDTWIDYFSDVAVSPDCNKRFLVSVAEGADYCDSVWVHAQTFPEAGYEEYNGKWLRTFCFKLQGQDHWKYEHGILRLAPEETDGMTVYLADVGSGNVYRNGVETLACWTPIASTAVTDIADLAVRDADTAYVVGYRGDVSKFEDGSWLEAVASEVEAGWTIAVHNDHVLVGGQEGDVSYSEDGGETFALLEKKTPVEGYVSVAFDSYFNQNHAIYAAVDGSRSGGIYAWFLGESTRWTDLDAAPHRYTGLVLDRPSPANPMTSPETGGVLYASYYNGDNGGGSTGVARCLTPLLQIDECAECPTEWDYLTVGLTGNEGFWASPDALKICGCLEPNSNSKLFAIDWDNYYDIDEGDEGAVWTFEDCYAKKAVELVSPVDDFLVPADPCNCQAGPFTVRWERLCDACTYEIQFASDPDFQYEVETLPLVTPTPAANPYERITADDVVLLPGETYYWRVRARVAGTTQEIRSWWSEGRSFMVAPAYGTTAITLVTPAPGALNQPTKNVGFSWSLLASWDNFDWVLSKNADLSNPVESKTGLTRTAYTCTKTLEYGTTYYWQVTAYKGGVAISASAVGTFTTAPTGAFCCPQCGLCFETQAQLQQHIADAHGPPPTPSWVWVVIAIGAVLVIVVIVLIFRTRRV